MSTTLKWGLITGMVYIIFNLISNLLGLQQNAGMGKGMGMGLLYGAVLLVATFYTIYLGVKESRDTDLNGYMTMGQGFLIGFKIALIASVILGVFTFIYLKFIDPGMIEKMKAMAESQWDQMNMAEDQREMARKWGFMFMSPIVMSAMAIIMVLFWGLIKGLVAGAMLKKDPPPTTMPVG